MKTSKKLIFFGTESFSGPSLEALVKAGYELLVVTKPDAPSGRGQNVKSPLVKSLAEKNNIEVLQPTKISDVASEIKDFGATHATLVAYGKIIPQAVIDIFPGGIVNVHPSLLPKYRGPAPIEAAILNGDDETGITLMALDSKMDTGPIYYQKKVPLNGKENAATLHDNLQLLGADILAEKLPMIMSGGLTPQPQDNSRATYTKMLSKKDGLVDWSQPAQIIERKIRAYIRYPRSRAEVHGVDVIITKARVASSQEDGQLVMKCGSGYLEVLELVAPSGKTMSGHDFALGYKF